jgi:hypothetical protein
MKTYRLSTMKSRIDARRTRRSLVALCLVAILGTGCGGPGSEVVISQQPLAGTIDGEAWSIGTVTGNWDPYSAFGHEYSFTMVPCGAPANADALVVLVPGVVGSYPVTAPGTSSGPTSTGGSTSTYPTWQPYPSGSGGTTGVGSNVAVYFASGLQATGGRVVISSASTTAVVGGADLTFDTGGHLNGQFQSTTCP